MRFRVDILLDTKLTLPLNYQSILQGVIYKAMPNEAAEIAHQQEKSRKYQVFTFSHLQGFSEVDIEKKTINFDRVHFFVSCIRDDIGFHIMQELANQIQIYGKVYRTQVSLLPARPSTSKVIRMLSPVSIRKTDRDSNFSYYLIPGTEEFSQAIYENLCRKYRYFYDEDYKGPFKLEPIGNMKGLNIKYRSTYIKGYMGKFNLEIDAKAMDLLYTVGLGAKNAQGFGMFKMEE